MAIKARQVRIRMRSRRDSEAAPELSTAPGKWSVLRVVLPARVIPGEPQRADVALRRMRQRETIGGGMSGVVQIQRLGGGGIDAFGGFRGHVDEIGRLHRPLRS